MDKFIKTPRMYLPRTGQTTQQRAGDDGNFQTGLPATNRFVDLGNGTIYDTKFDLQFVKQPELIIPTSSGQVQVARGAWSHPNLYTAGDLVTDGGLFYVALETQNTTAVFADDLAAGWWVVTPWTASAADLTSPATMLWAAAIDACGPAALDYCGFTDWRIPNRYELASLFVTEFGTSPTIDATYFPNTKVDWYYWSSSTSSQYTDRAYAGSFLSGNIAGNSWTFSRKAVTPEYVRPVRGGIMNA